VIKMTEKKSEFEKTGKVEEKDEKKKKPCTG
jgi:hypothetical protein